MGPSSCSPPPAAAVSSPPEPGEPASERPNVFKTPLGSRPNVEAAIEYLTAQGIDAVGVIAVNNPYGDSGVTAWEQVTGEPGAGAELVGVERFEGDDTDMTAQLNNLVGAGAEAIAVVAIPPGAPTVRRNAVDGLGLDLPMVFDAGAGAELFIELAGSAADGALVTHPPTLIWDEVDQDDPQYEALQAFGTAYTEEYGDMSGFAGYAWDALGLLRAAIEDAGSTEYGAIVEALEGMGEYVGVDGVYRLSEDDHQGLDADALRILTVQDGEWTLAEGADGGG
jgi:branched-chain amino acid transport system substrate-binding protein